MKSINPASFADNSYCKEGKTAVFLLKLLQINLNQDLSEVLSVFMIIKIKAVSKKTALIYLIHYNNYALYSTTALMKASAFSTGILGRIPCPRLAIYLSFPKRSIIS